MKRLVAPAALLALSACASTTVNLATAGDGISWNVTHATAEAVETDGKQAVRLVAEGDSNTGIIGLALPPGLEFSTGTIEVDLKGRNIRQRSFVGVAFNVVDERTFEAVYFRPFNFRAEEPRKNRAVQYVAWPTNTWEHLRKNTPGQFEHAVNPIPDPDGWFHARIEVTDAQVKVFVNDSKEASLITNRLSTGGVPRPAGLFVDTGDGHYANLKVTSNKWWIP